ncbi:MAG: MFS transporter [Desulfuromusa sp.]
MAFCELKSQTGKKDQIPQTVWALGFVSLFMDISSEIIHSLLPVFLVSVLGASVGMVGLIEGVAEGTVMITRIFSGSLSDWLGRRKVLALFGYGLGALSKPLFALAPGIGVAFTARLVDRIGKGVRGAPRDALIADVTLPNQRGAAYGLRQSLDSVGAFAGPLLAIGLMLWTGNQFRTVFWIAFIPGVIAVIILFKLVKEPKFSGRKTFISPFKRKNLALLGRHYWLVVLVGVLFTLARFSEAFLLLRAEDIGLRVALIPLILVVMNIAYSLTAFPAGKLSDRIGRKGLMASGLLVLIAADLLLGAAGTLWQVFLGVGLWGLHLGLTQGILSAWIADSANPDLRGTAFGVFGLCNGIAILIASVLAGWLWQRFSPDMTFFSGAGIAAAALLGFMLIGKVQPPGVKAF